MQIYKQGCNKLQLWAEGNLPHVESVATQQEAIKKDNVAVQVQHSL